MANYAFMYPSLFFFLTMSEFFRPCPISKEEFFPPCQNFSPFPSYMLGKIPSWVTEGIPAYLMQKNAVVSGDSKNIPLTVEVIICRMYGYIPQECRKIFLFYSVCLLCFANAIFLNNYVCFALLDSQFNINLLPLALIFEFLNVNMFASLQNKFFYCRTCLLCFTRFTV